MKHLYCLATFLLFTCAAVAQGLPGYVVTLSGDTVQGVLTERKHQRIELRTATNEVRRFRPATVRGYGLQGSAVIQSRIVHLASGADSTRFVLPTYTGPASLYSYADESGFLLLPAATDTLYEVTAANWHVVFNRFLRACPAIDHTSREMMEQRYDPLQLDRILMRYNKCVDSTWRKPQHTATSAAWRRGVGVQVGLFLYSHAYDGPAVISKQVGVSWTFLRASGLQITVSPSYMMANGTGQPYVQLPVEQQRHWREQQLLIEAALDHRFTLIKGKKPQIFVGTGFTTSVLLVERYSMTQRPYGSNMPFQQGEIKTTAGSYLLVNALGTMGFIFPMGNQSELKIGSQVQFPLSNKYTAIGARIAYTFFYK